MNITRDSISRTEHKHLSNTDVKTGHLVIIDESFRANNNTVRKRTESKKLAVIS